jgi:hypothetical protein
VIASLSIQRQLRWRGRSGTIHTPSGSVADCPLRVRRTPRKMFDYPGRIRTAEDFGLRRELPSFKREWF